MGPIGVAMPPEPVARREANSATKTSMREPSRRYPTRRIADTTLSKLFNVEHSYDHAHS
jgi:hypothetical protein